jgi:hypothetical protein
MAGIGIVNGLSRKEDLILYSIAVRLRSSSASITVARPTKSRYARMHAMEESKSAYSHFLTRWKDADPDIPILKQARAEYAKLD